MCAVEFQHDVYLTIIITSHEIMDKILDIIFLLFLTAILFIYYHKEVVEGLQGVLIAYKDIRGL